MSGFAQINLADLPAPAIIETPAFEDLFAEMKAKAIELEPGLADALALESEPATKMLRVGAYYRMLDRLWFNDGAKANMLALATGTDLDGLAAFWGVARLVIQAADDTLTPPAPEILESDADFRRRVQLSLEGHSTAGPRGAYIFWALSADADVKDASVDSPTPGAVVVTVLSRSGDGAPDAGLLTIVADALNDDDVRPLTDQLSVQAPTILAYQVTAELTLYHGPDGAEVLAAAQAAITTYADAMHRLDHDITLSGIYAALHQSGVQRVELTSPAADIAVAANEAAYCDAITVTIGGRDV